MPKTASDPIAYAKKSVNNALGSMDRLKSLKRYSELTPAHRTQIFNALRDKLNEVEDILDGNSEDPSSFDFSIMDSEEVGE